MQIYHNKLFSSNKRGFSLIEIMIVSALLAIFAGIAMINISRLYQANKTRASRGDLKMFAEAVEFFVNDIDFYPKLNYLMNAEPIVLEPTYTQAQQDEALRNIHYMGFDVSHLKRRLDREWRGKYVGISPGRTCRMNIASAAYPPMWVDYPKDFWGNPYVIYLLKTNYRVPQGVSFLEDASDEPNYDVLMVGYGQDKFPGSFTNPTAPHQSVEVARKEDQRLFVKLGGNQFQMLNFGEYGPVQLSGYSEQKYGDASLTGVIDEGSDDIMIRIK